MSKRAWKIISSVVLSIGLFAGVILVQNIASYENHAAGTPANLSIDLSNSYPDAKNSWQFLSQGGEEKGRPLLPVVPQVKQLSPQYIRVDHVFDFFSVVSSVNGQSITYNWQNLDAYIADIRATGAKPFLALSYTPALLGAHDTDMPDLSLWRSLIKATVEHVSGKRGLAIPDVYYEVWNEPDLFGQFKINPPKDYRDLYKATSDGALSAQDVLPFKLGGPATTALYKNWFDGLSQLSATQRIKYDFFSWHVYGQDTSILDQNISSVLLWKAQLGIPNLELFVTEHGLDAANNPGYDNTLSVFNTLSAGAIAADRINGLMSFEIKDGPGPTQKWGRWGLFTHEKYGTPVAKPRYAALTFLNRMAQGERINVAGNGSFVRAFGRQDTTTARVMVVNYDQYGKHAEAVPVRFFGIKAPKMLFVRTDLFGNTTKLVVVPTNGEWKTVLYFNPNSAATLELTPQN